MLVTASNLRRGAKSFEEHLLLVQAEVTSLAHPPLIDLSEFLGEELKCSLTADPPLHEVIVQLPQVLVSRDLVQRIVQTEALRLRQPVEAPANGEAREFIVVRRTSF